MLAFPDAASIPFRTSPSAYECVSPLVSPSSVCVPSLLEVHLSSSKLVVVERSMSNLSVRLMYHHLLLLLP